MIDLDIETAKHFVERYSGLDRDALHVHVSLMLYIASMVLLRKSVRSVSPLLVVLAVEIANEAFDLRRHWHQGPSGAVAESSKDLWNTMLWPTMLILSGRYTTWFGQTTAVEHRGSNRSHSLPH